MKRLLFALLLLCPAMLIAQKSGRSNCEPDLSNRELHNIIREVIQLRHIDTTYLLFPSITTLNPGEKDNYTLKWLIKPVKPHQYQAWSELDAADVDHMLCIRKKHKRLEWDPGKLGFKNAPSSNAITFSFPYTSRDGKTIIVSYGIFGWYSSANKYIYDGGYTLAIIKDGDKIKIEELSRWIR